MTNIQKLSGRTFNKKCLVSEKVTAPRIGCEVNVDDGDDDEDNNNNNNKLLELFQNHSENT
jgi:hypothetical protein